jgi:hypothetical protein
MLWFGSQILASALEQQHLILSAEKKSASDVVALNPCCGKYILHEAPLFHEDTAHEYGLPQIRIYTSIDARFVLEDFICKLQLTYGTKETDK